MLLARRGSTSSGSGTEDPPSSTREGLRMGEISPTAGAAPHPPLPPLPPAVTVRASSVLPGHLTIGPLPERATHLGSLTTDLALGLYCSDTRDTHYALQVRYSNGSVHCEQDPTQSFSWMSYVQPARDRHEQNIEAIRDGKGRVHFRCVRQIAKGEELYVWYSDELARQCSIPILTPANIRGEAEYTCNRCLKSFRYPNTLKSHMRFHCPAIMADRTPINYGLFPPTMLPPVMRQSPECPTGPRNICHTELNSAFRPHKHSMGTKCGSPPTESVITPPINMIRHSKDEKENRLNGNEKTASPPISAERSTGLERLPASALGQYHPLLFQSYLDKMATMSQYSAMALYGGLYAGLPPYCCNTRPPPNLPNASVPPYLHGLAWPAMPEPVNRRPSPPEPREEVPSPSQHPVPAFNFPMPSEKEGEPLDLLPKSLYSTKSSKGHMCIYCGKLYSRKYGLKIHLRTHTGYKPLKCKVCQRPFGDPSNLNKHIRLHAEGDTPYRCQYCGKVLVRRRDLERHIRSRHPNEAEGEVTGMTKTWVEGNEQSPVHVSESSDPEHLDESFDEDPNQEIEVEV